MQVDWIDTGSGVREGAVRGTMFALRLLERLRRTSSAHQRRAR